MDEPTVRPARAEDAEALADIYNHYIETSTATFDQVPKTAEERLRWLDSREPAHPVLVAESDGEVLAWGSLSTYRERPAWRHTVEVGVYVRAGETGRGLGTVLLDELVRLGRSRGHHALVAQVVAENEASLKLFARAGFQRVGTLREVGHKFGRWLDVVILELIVSPEIQ